MTSWIAPVRSRRGCCPCWRRRRPRRKTPTGSPNIRGMVSVWVSVCLSKCTCLADFQLSLHSKSGLQCSGLLPENWSQAASNSETEANPFGETHIFFFFMCLEVCVHWSLVNDFISFLDVLCVTGLGLFSKMLLFVTLMKSPFSRQSSDYLFCFIITLKL